ncbi:MAG: hypothetical protein HDR09_17875 [Lachnospiraceae bacterium]|nr:hypothetical protein [Lachnospiraceae bacterium]
MKKLCIGIVISIVSSILISSFWPSFGLEEKISTLYAVSGIMFSIGMSIIVTGSCVKVPNKKIRQRIVLAFNEVRNSYIIFFLAVSIFYMFMEKNSTPFHIYRSISFNYPYFVGVLIVSSIIFFIVNFLDIQRLNREIAEAVEN